MLFIKFLIKAFAQKLEMNATSLCINNRQVWIILRRLGAFFILTDDNLPCLTF